MPDMFRVKVVLQQFLDAEPIDLFYKSKNVVGIDKILEVLRLLYDRTLEDIEELKKQHDKGFRC